MQGLFAKDCYFGWSHSENTQTFVEGSVSILELISSDFCYGRLFMAPWILYNLLHSSLTCLQTTYSYRWTATFCTEIGNLSTQRPHRPTCRSVSSFIDTQRNMFWSLKVWNGEYGLLAKWNTVHIRLELIVNSTRHSKILIITLTKIYNAQVSI